MTAGIVGGYVPGRVQQICVESDRDELQEHLLKTPTRAAHM